MKRLLSTIHNIKARYFNRQPHSLIYQWTISYISVLLLPLLIFSFYYVHTYRVIRESSESNQKLILENANEQLNYMIYDSLTISNTLVLNNYVRSLSFNNPILDDDPNIERHYLSKELHSIKASNGLIEDIIIYFPHTDYLVSTESAHQASLLTKMNRTPVYLDDLKLLTTELKEDNILCLQSGTTSSLLLAQPLLKNHDNEILSLTLLRINKKNLRDRLHNSLISENQSSFILLNEKDVLLSFGKDISAQDNAPVIWKFFSEAVDSAAFNHEYVLNNQTCILNYKSSLIPNAALVSITEKSVYNVTIYQLLETLLISMIFCLLLGLGVTLYFSRKNYRPVSQIMDYIDTESGDLNSNNEYQLITRFLKKKQNELEYQRSLLRNNYILKILSGEIPASQMSPQFSLHFSSPHTCVVGIQMIPETVTEYGSDNGQLLYFIIQNILSELLKPVFPEHDYCIVSQHEIFVLINIPTGDPQSRNYVKEIQRVIHELHHLLSANYDIEFIAGVSNINSNEAIPESRIQVNSILEFLRLFGQSKINTYDELNLNSDITAIHLNTQDYVQNLLISGSAEQLDEYFSFIYRDIKSKNLSTSDAKSCFYFFYLTTIQICCYCQTHYAFTPNSLAPVNDRTYFSKSLQQSLETIHASYRDFIKEFADFRDVFESSGWGNDICRYIENNYFDVNLNLNNVAEHCSLSPAYLSKKFKEKFNKSVNDYLNEIRISHAKQLITDTNLNMSEIAQMTGFIDSSAFIRIFKKYVGTTPGKYKSSSSGGI